MKVTTVLFTNNVHFENHFQKLAFSCPRNAICLVNEWPKRKKNNNNYKFLLENGVMQTPPNSALAYFGIIILSEAKTHKLAGNFVSKTSYSLVNY